MTEDGSITYRNMEFDETYHTKSGAQEEAIEKHAKPLKVWEKEDSIIYDVCFGLGYNAAAAIDEIRNHNNNSRITVYCFENDKEILGKILEIETKFKSFGFIKEFIRRFLEKGETKYFDENVEIIMIFGDIRQTLKENMPNADFVFFDPFSPKKHPELWEKSIFEDLNKHMNDGAKLSTYSYARIVRDRLKESGFEVLDGPIIGRRCPSTIAIKR